MFVAFAPTAQIGMAPEVWQEALRGISTVLTNACRAVDPQSTDEVLEELEEDR